MRPLLATVTATALCAATFTASGSVASTAQDRAPAAPNRNAPAADTPPSAVTSMDMSQMTAVTAASKPGATPRWAQATLRSNSGTIIGTVTFRDTSRGTQVHVQARWVKLGFHGLHLHTIGKCQLNSPDPKNPAKRGAYLSAGGHWMAGTQKHPQHIGDLGVLLANKDTRTDLTTVTDRFKVADLFDSNGTAVMMHQGVDNFANVPPRYAPKGPDAETHATGDAGVRAACGVIRR